MNDHQLIVVGAGIVGLATARAAQRDRHGDVVVIDKASGPGAQQTGHNSGVIHSGLYYRPGSHKARLCVAGARAMVDFCAEHGVPYRTPGKVVVAVDERELAGLAELERRGIANGVMGIRRLDSAGIAALEPHATGLAGLHVPGTGVTDYVAVARALMNEIDDGGGSVRWGTTVRDIRRDGDLGAVTFEDGTTIRSRRVIVCGGIQSDRLAGTRRTLRMVPFRGAYFDLVPDASALVTSMIYPVPDPRFPFLGVHFTRHVDDSVSAGPNAILHLARERHRRYAFDVRDARDVATFPGMWRLAGRYWRPGGREVALDLSLRLYLKQLQRYVPEIESHHLTPGPVGIRAQAVDRSGRLLDDFEITRDGPITYVLNAPSPAATASLAIGLHIAQLAAEE